MHLTGAGPLLLLGVTLLEPGHSAAGVEDLLLAGVERVAGRADIGAKLAFAGRAASLERVAAGATDLGDHVVRVNVALHVVSSQMAAAGSNLGGVVNQSHRKLCHLVVS